VLQIQMALLFLLYFAPTPGSAGFAEVFSLSAMAAIVPSGFAPYYNLLWRTSTVYLPAVLGLLFLSFAILRDTRIVLRRRGRPCSSPSESPSLIQGVFNPDLCLRTGGPLHHGSLCVGARRGPRFGGLGMHEVHFSEKPFSPSRHGEH